MVDFLDLTHSGGLRLKLAIRLLHLALCIASMSAELRTHDRDVGPNLPAGQTLHAAGTIARVKPGTLYTLVAGS